MNKERRERLDDAASQLDEVADIIRDIQSDEQDALDNMPEGFQNGERGESMIDAIEEMDDFISDIEWVRDKIQKFIS